MTTLVLTLLRLGFLALLWIFVISLVLTVRKDVYGTEIVIGAHRIAMSHLPRRKPTPCAGWAWAAHPAHLAPLPRHRPPPQPHNHRHTVLFSP